MRQGTEGTNMAMMKQATENKPDGGYEKRIDRDEIDEDNVGDETETRDGDNKSKTRRHS